MIGLPQGKCRSCEAPVFYFARLCPNCGAANQPNPVATVAALAAVVLLAGVAVLALQSFRGRPTSQAPSSGPDTAASDTAGEADYGWIVKAMAECEEEAKVRTEIRHFLIVPLTQSGTSLPGWSPDPISSVGSSAVL